MNATPPVARVAPREVLRFSFPLMLGAVAGTVLQRSDVIMIGAIAGAAAVGSYEPVLRAFDVAPLIVASLGYYFFPVGASLVRKGDVRRLQDAFVSVSKWGMVLSMPLLMTMLVAPVPLLEALFGPRFADSRAIAMTLAVGYIVNVVAGVNGGALVALGATRQIAMRSVALIALNVVGNLLLIPRIGALGAAVATTIVVVGLNAYNSSLAWKMARLTPFRRDSVTCLATAIASALAVAAVSTSAMRASLAGSISVFLGVALSGGVVALLTLHPGERRMVKSLVANFGGPPLTREPEGVARPEAPPAAAVPAPHGPGASG
jgi:O-antigen/teichoic acid export membrane protein